MLLLFYIISCVIAAFPRSIFSTAPAKRVFRRDGCVADLVTTRGWPRIQNILVITNNSKIWTPSSFLDLTAAVQDIFVKRNFFCSSPDRLGPGLPGGRRCADDAPTHCSRLGAVAMHGDLRVPTKVVGGPEIAAFHHHSADVCRWPIRAGSRAVGGRLRRTVQTNVRRSSWSRLLQRLLLTAVLRCTNADWTWKNA